MWTLDLANLPAARILGRTDRTLSGASMGAHTPQEVMDLHAFWFAFRLLRYWRSWGAGREIEG